MSHVLGEAARRDVAAAFVAGSTLWLALHDANPGPRGEHEIEGYPMRRQPLHLRREGPGFAQSADARFIVPGCKPTWLGIWTAQRGGQFRGAGEITGAADGEPYEQGDICVVPAGTVVVNAY